MKIKITSLDRLFSKYIKARDKYCQRCGGSSGLQTAHFHGRASLSVRHDPDNACLLCYGCHMYFHGHPLEFVEFFRARLGEEKFDRLKMRAQGVKNTDMAAVRIYLKTLLDGELAR